MQSAVEEGLVCVEQFKERGSRRRRINKGEEASDTMEVGGVHSFSIHTYIYTSTDYVHTQHLLRSTLSSIINHRTHSPPCLSYPSASLLPFHPPSSPLPSPTSSSAACLFTLVLLHHISLISEAMTQSKVQIHQVSLLLLTFISHYSVSCSLLPSHFRHIFSPLFFFCFPTFTTRSVRYFLFFENLLPPILGPQFQFS